tara:strand:+ start:1099 stop:1839 length:741 start_codon:yes stop_codon:yes gene_type:complete
MKRIYLVSVMLILFSCKEKTKSDLSADEIINKAIEVSGGNLYKSSKISFSFRNKDYVSENSGTILKRSFKIDSIKYTDVKNNSGFERYINDALVLVSDSLASLYSNSINSVHYFAQLPYRLNDKSVNKELLEEKVINNKTYYVVKVTFDKKGGGDDFEDTYYYWIQKESFKPDYLAYDFHENGGGVRFRKAYNERYVNGIRFVDYKNYKPKNHSATIEQIADLYSNNQLELLSEIKLENIKVDKEN